ncbi:MAG: DUF255 domain-containing protein [Proteobacteria bacterium]|nr:DUF255 domain-containing protein [Pseudomonadota bacterium]
MQHAYNPVNWYPWGGEAINRAVKENKPIILSIGYSTCHLCHVMEYESFTNNKIASAYKITDIITKNLSHEKVFSPSKKDKQSHLYDAFKYYSSSFDDKYGGFGKAPKFPSPSIFKFLFACLTYANIIGDIRTSPLPIHFRNPV